LLPLLSRGSNRAIWWSPSLARFKYRLLTRLPRPLPAFPFAFFSGDGVFSAFRVFLAPFALLALAPSPAMGFSPFPFPLALAVAVFPRPPPFDLWSRPFPVCPPSLFPLGASLSPVPSCLWPPLCGPRSFSSSPASCFFGFRFPLPHNPLPLVPCPIVLCPVLGPSPFRPLRPGFLFLAPLSSSPSSPPLFRLPLSPVAAGFLASGFLPPPLRSLACLPFPFTGGFFAVPLSPPPLLTFSSSAHRYTHRSPKSALPSHFGGSCTGPLMAPVFVFPPRFLLGFLSASVGALFRPGPPVLGVLCPLFCFGVCGSVPSLGPPPLAR